MRILWIMLPLTLLLTAGCIGTDFTDEPLQPQPSEAVIEEAEISLIEGDIYTLSFKLLATDGSKVPSTWEWSSRNENVATISPEGTVMGEQSGQTWVDGIANGEFRDSVLVNITNDPDAIASVTITGDATNMNPGDTRQLEAELRNIGGGIVPGTITWTSSDDNVLTVDQNGLVTAVAIGTASITATSEGIQSVPFQITVGTSASSRSGEFSGLNGYSASGTATLTSGVGATLSFSDNFQTQSGPGLYIYLSPSKTSVSGGVNLGKIISTSGSQTYEIPGTVDPEDYDHIIIYCQPFGVLFGAATVE